MVKFFKPRLPRGLIGRAALILIAPIVTIQLIVSVFFIQRHFDDVTRQMVAGIELELLSVLAAAADAPQDPVGAAAAVAGPLEIGVAAVSGQVRPGNRRAFWDLSGRVVIEMLNWHIPGLRGVDLLADPEVVLVLIGPAPADMMITIDRRRVTASNPHQLLVLMLGAGMVLTLIAYLFLRRQLDPIAQLAVAAEAFGKGRSLPFRPRGALEVRAAGAAFVEMRARIERQIEQRTLLLSGVSHDLRTPLTRLKLGLAMLDDDEDVQALQRDVSEMERMLEAFLAFARGDAMNDPEPADPVEIVRHVVEDARRAGHHVELLHQQERQVPDPAPGLVPDVVPGRVLDAASVAAVRKDPVKVMLRADSVSRALANLISNAARHGTRTEVGVQITERWVRFCVEDDGPGIPKELREEAIRPFTRLDAARDPNRGGGVGLGLAIAADVARGHGGSLRLGQSERLGGLRAELLLSR